MFSAFILRNNDDKSAYSIRAQKWSNKNRIARILLYDVQYRDIFSDKVRNTEHKKLMARIGRVGIP